MKFDLEGAQKAGYSDEEISDFLSKSHPDFDIQEAMKAGYSSSDVNNFLKDKESESLSKRITRTASQPIQAAAEFSPVGIALSGLELFGTGEALAEMEDLKERWPQLKKQFPNLPDEFPEQDYLRGLQGATEYFPSIRNIARKVEKSTGIPLEPKSKLDKAIRFVSGAAKIKTGTASQKIMAGLKGQAVKSGLEAGGVPEGAAELTSLPYALFEKAPAGFKLPKEKSTKKSSSDKGPDIIGTENEILPSGLTKHKAIGAKNPEKGIISKERQEKTIKGLNEEAAKIAQKSLEKHLPISKKIQEGFDFEGQWEKGFGEIKKAAEKFNPEVDITPISQLLSKTAKKYKGIPKLHPEGQKVVHEIRAFRNKPQTSLNNLLKIFRSNHQKIKSIYETSRLTGKQQEYVDFLLDMNRNITKSFENTFPKGGAWVEQFKGLNKEFSNYKDAIKTLKILDPLLHQRTTPASLQRFAVDKKLQDRLKLSMGDEGAKEIIQLAKDLKLAREAIKKIPARDFKGWEKFLPLSFFVPFGNVIGTVLTGAKGLDYAKRAYGYFLSTPARRKIYGEVLDNIIKGDKEGFLKAEQKLIEYQPNP